WCRPYTRALHLVTRHLVDVTVERLTRADLVLNAVDHGHQHGRPCQIAVAARIRTTEFEAPGLRTLRVHRDPNRRGTISGRQREIYWRFEPRNETAVGVRGRRCEREERRRVLQQAAGCVKTDLAQSGIAVAGERWAALFPQRLVGVHTAAVVLENRLGHERDGLVAPARDVLADVLVPHELIGHFEKRSKLHVDLTLTRRRHFVMMRFDDDPDLAHLVHHLTAKIVVRIGWTDRKIPTLETRFVAQVRLLDARCVPRALD